MESTSIHMQTAPLWRRLLALIYDLFLLCAISMIYGAIAIGLNLLIIGNPEDNNYQPLVGGALFQIGWVLSLSIFYSFFWLRGGQTAGMRAWRLKLISTQTTPISIKHCFLRILCGIPSFFIIGLGYLWALVDKNKDCLHDKISQTRVVVTEKNTKK